MAFTDGEPIDAAKLGSLESQITRLTSLIPTVGASTTNIDINNTLPSVAPQIYGGVTSTVSLTPGTSKSFTIDYTSAGLTSVPKSIVLTPLHNSGGANMQAYVDKATVSDKKATGRVFLPSGYTAFSTQFYFIVVCHN